MGGGAEETGLLELKLVELLLAVHLDNKWDDQDEEGGAGDPGGLAGAAEELLGDEGGVGGSALRLVEDRGLGHRARHAGEEGVAAVTVSTVC